MNPTTTSTATIDGLARVLEASRGSFNPFLARIAEDHVPGSGTSVLVVAPRRGSGGSTTAACLAAALALQSGQSVLLIDANVYEPVQHSYFGLPAGPGLLHVAQGTVDLSAAARPTSVRNLDLLPAGATSPTDPGALGASAVHVTIDRGLDLADIVLIDGPSVLEHPDVFSLRGHVTHVVLVIGAGRTSKRDGREAVRVLRAAGLAPTGIILDRFRPASFLGLEWPR